MYIIVFLRLQNTINIWLKYVISDLVCYIISNEVLVYLYASRTVLFVYLYDTRALLLVYLFNTSTVLPVYLYDTSAVYLYTCKILVQC